MPNQYTGSTPKSLETQHKRAEIGLMNSESHLKDTLARALNQYTVGQAYNNNTIVELCKRVVLLEQKISILESLLSNYPFLDRSLKP